MHWWNTEYTYRLRRGVGRGEENCVSRTKRPFRYERDLLAHLIRHASAGLVSTVHSPVLLSSFSASVGWVLHGCNSHEQCGRTRITQSLKGPDPWFIFFSGFSNAVPLWQHGLRCLLGSCVCWTLMFWHTLFRLHQSLQITLERIHDLALSSM